MDSYVLRGLSENGAVIPDYFLETASAAVAAATSIIESLLEDRDLQMGLARVPHYFHGMVAFACMFLLKVATKHKEQLFVDVGRFRTLIAGLGQQLKVTDVGKEHLIHRMAEGLEKMVEMLSEMCGQRRQKRHEPDRMQSFGTTSGITMPTASPSHNGPTPSEQETMDSSTFDFGDSALLGMPFFDFEGTTLDLGGPNYPFLS